MEAGATVLLVEDDELVSRSWRRLLEARGYSVVVARSLSEARAEIRCDRGGDVRSVILDLELPDGRGEELVGELDVLAPEARTAVVSGCIDAASALRLMARGVFAVPKPVDGSQLIALVDGLVSRGRAQQRLAIFSEEHRLSRTEAAVLAARSPA